MGIHQSRRPRSIARATLTALFASILLPSATLADPGRLPVLMASLGDSITAATFADSPLGGTSTEANIENKETLSWTSGQKIRSHHLLLQNHLAGTETAEVLNPSIAGARVGAMLKQADAVVEAMGSGKYRQLKYVTVMFGANDVCRKVGPTPEAEFLEQMAAGFARLASIPQAERIPVLVAGIPKIPDLGKKGVTEFPGVEGQTCAEVFDILSMCAPMVKWETEAEYEARVEIVRRYNGLIGKAVALAAAKHPNLDLLFSDKIFEIALEAPMLAIDCFHPNWKTQERISTELWELQPWFKNATPARARLHAEAR